MAKQKNKVSNNPRAVAVGILQQVLAQGQSLSAQLPEALEGLALERRALTQELCYGTLRWLPRLEWLLGQLLDKPLKAKDQDVHLLALLGLYQLGFMQIPPHAIVSETVAVTTTLNKPWARGLINALLRRYQREQSAWESALAKDPVAHSAHPAWLLQLLQRAWPKDWEAIVQANNQRPPMTLRVNRRQASRDDYLQQLQQQGIAATATPHAPDGLTLARPQGIEQLPGFASGRASVQDAAAQLAATLLATEAGMRVLDACAAPGGKTGHILECSDPAEVVALDVDEQRLARVAQNLARLGLSATLLSADAATPSAWWDGKPFERILLDAPCSASGVIRRHPDIKSLRRAGDIATLVTLQATILDALWPLLAPGGMLLYATCSILPEENHQQLASFLARHGDAQEQVIDAAWGQAAAIGRQILPNQDGMDGFYYACIRKQ